MAWTDIPDLTAASEQGDPLDVLLLAALIGNLEYLLAQLQTHDHDGADSALISVGPNLVRNGGFEEGLTGWTPTTYAGGTVVSSTTGHMEGAKCLAITSTSLATGGGDVVSEEYVPVTGGDTKQFVVSFSGSVAGIAAKAEVIWYDSAQAQISASQMFANADIPTSKRTCIKKLAAPANARYCRMKLTGGTPGQGTSTGTIYFDGARIGDPAVIGGEQLFTASGTFSAIWGDVEVELQARGGDGSADYAGPDGAGGGAGGAVIGSLVINGDTAVTVGGAGAATSIGSLSATAGSNGVIASESVPSVPGAGGVGSGGTINITGMGGSGGQGGASLFGKSGGDRPSGAGVAAFVRIRW